MENKGLALGRLRIEYLRYTEMINFIYDLYSKEPEKLSKKLKNDLIDLNDIKKSLNEMLVDVEKQINFIENFLDDCGVDVYEA